MGPFAGRGRTQAEAQASRFGMRAERCRKWRTTFLRASDRAESTKDLFAGLTARHVEPLIGSAARR
jgi:hypothetical protein